MFDEIIENLQNDIIHSVCELIKFKSVSLESGNSDMPFGEECKKALEYTLNLAESLGFRTKNIDGYCGTIEFGEGEELVGIIGHLDVVPAQMEDGWKTDPFLPSIREHKLYGRGAIDDKGPVIASLYAMKAILDSGKKIKKRVRLILGLNEEKSWKCIKHYKKVGEEFPTIGFSPDADFPCIYAEKGILSIQLQHPFSIPHITIQEIDCQNNALNVVPKFCSITLKYDSPENRISFKNTNKITIEAIDSTTQKITASGIAAHAAHPDLGDNAITTLIEYLSNYLNKGNYLQKLSELGILEIESPKFLSKETMEDESGILTSNVGFLNFANNQLEIDLNLRVPVHTSLSEVKAKYESLREILPDMQVQFTSEQAPLHVAKNSELVQTLTKIFCKKTGLNAEPIAIGGGTYARAFPNCVAFGANMPGNKDMCHQVDEFMDIENLVLSTKIYAEAIYALANGTWIYKN